MPDLQPVSWERMIRAVVKVRERLLRAAAALEAAGVPYAVTGGNAVAWWVSRVDEAAVRNTPDVDLLVRTELSSYRVVNRLHVRDLIDVGLVDASWRHRFTSPLRGRLTSLLDDPDG